MFGGGNTIARITEIAGEKKYYRYHTEVTEAEFNKFLEEIIKGEEMCVISQEEFVDCTEENLIKIFLE